MTHSLTIPVCHAQWKPVKVAKKLNRESWDLKCRSDDTFQHPSREWHLITSLSRTNEAECKRRSPSNGLCCRGSLERRSFILFSTSICPRGFCSSVARRVSLLCLFIASTSGCVSGCGGGRVECGKNRHVFRLCVVIYAHLCVCARTCRLSLHVLFPKCLRRTCSKATALIDQAARPFSFRAISRVLNCFP